MRTIKTAYYNAKREVIKENTSMDANLAVSRCVYYMQANYYGAKFAEVYDTESGEQHAAVKMVANGNINIIYKRNPQEYERRLSARAFD
jgi:hypothetical protein